MRNLEEFNQKYKGKPCFVLGAGCSLSFEDLSLLDGSVTIAVNSSYVGYPQATFFISDDWAVKHWSYFFDTLKKSTTTIPLLFESKLGNTVSWFGDRGVLFRHKNGYVLTDSYNHFDRKFHIWEARTSVGSAIHVAHIMGCNPICLLGIDCCRYHNFRYFWQMEGYEKPYRDDGVPIDNFKKTKIRGIQTDTDLNSITSYWNNLKKHLQDKNIQIYNISQLSVLDVFPKSTIKEVLHV